VPKHREILDALTALSGVLATLNYDGLIEQASNRKPVTWLREAEQLRGRNFMLCSVGGRSYAFVHRTFLEYFCALEIRERFQTDQTLTIGQLKMEIFAHWAEESWHKVLCLLTGMIAPRFVAEVLEYLLQQPDPQQTCHAIFLAARCVSEVRKRNELGSITRKILDRVKALVRFDLNFFYQEWDEEKARVVAIRTRAVSTVALIWRDAPDTRTWLKARAQSDEDSAVRYTAVQELAQGWKEDPDTLPILKQRATSDNAGSVRYTAVQEVARGPFGSFLTTRKQSDSLLRVTQKTLSPLSTPRWMKST
jgi:predicted NACHT family NTPase